RLQRLLARRGRAARDALGRVLRRLRGGARAVLSPNRGRLGDVLGSLLGKLLRLRRRRERRGRVLLQLLDADLAARQQARGLDLLSGRLDASKPRGCAERYLAGGEHLLDEGLALEDG